MQGGKMGSIPVLWDPFDLLVNKSIAKVGGRVRSRVLRLLPRDSERMRACARARPAAGADRAVVWGSRTALVLRRAVWGRVTAARVRPPLDWSGVDSAAARVRRPLRRGIAAARAPSVAAWGHSGACVVRLVPPSPALET